MSLVGSYRSNKEIFEENYVPRGSPSMAIIQYTDLIYKSSCLANKFKAGREEKLIGWNPPSTSWVKLNTDGAFKVSSGMASIGGRGELEMKMVIR